MEKQNIIIDAALKIFGMHGYKKTSISDIAKYCRNFQSNGIPLFWYKERAVPLLGKYVCRQY